MPLARLALLAALTITSYGLTVHSHEAFLALTAVAAWSVEEYKV